MRDKSATEKDSAAEMKSGVPWHVVDVRAVSDHSLTVLFADGTRGEVDMARLLASEAAGVFAVLRDPAVFRKVRIEHGAVTWPGEIDLAPDAMYDDIRETGAFPATNAHSLCADSSKVGEHPLITRSTLRPYLVKAKKRKPPRR